MEFCHNPIGPKAGLCFTNHGISARLLSLHETKPLSDEECTTLAAVTNKLLHDLDIMKTMQPFEPSEPIEVEQSPLHSRKSPIPTFTKYTTKENFNAYFSRGSFQIGSIVGYKITESLHAKDPMEGFCNVVFNNRKRSIFAPVMAGDNLRLFCGSTNKNSQYLKKKFGTVRMILRDIESFGDAIANYLGANSWKVGSVTYSNKKVYRLNAEQDISLSLKDLTKNPKSMRGIYDFITKECAPGTIFLKPLDYSPEEEARFLFEMNHDLENPWDYVVDRNLLNNFEIIQE